MKALIIEDEPMIRLVLVRLLTPFFPAGVLTAEDGQEGLTIVRRERPAIVFCDVFMPKVDGIAFLEQLRADPVHADLPVIAISSARDRDLVQHLVRLRIADYLVKPIHLDRTRRRLGRLLPILLPSTSSVADASTRR